MGGSWSNHHFTPLLLIIVLIPRFMLFYLSFIPSSYSLNLFIPTCFPLVRSNMFSNGSQMILYYLVHLTDLFMQVVLTVQNICSKASSKNFFTFHVQIGVWYSNNTLAMNSTSLDINASESLANKTLTVTTILVRTSPVMTS